MDSETRKLHEVRQSEAYAQDLRKRALTMNKAPPTSKIDMSHLARNSKNQAIYDKQRQF